jgi:hypothetical protein
MSYYKMTSDMWRGVPAGTPGWQLAPVPGWGVNPDRSGPPILAASGLGEGPMVPTVLNEGHLALAAAGGILVGWLVAYSRLSRR